MPKPNKDVKTSQDQDSSSKKCKPD